MKVTKVEALERIANNIRISIVEEVNQAKSGHLGGSLSCADILTVLYFNEMNISPDKPSNLSRDRFVLSKGHASTALYATLAERGFFQKEDLLKFRKFESYLQGHPDMNKVPGVDITTGSLGQGLSIANGMAIASKMDKAGYRVYCMIGDGELQEGQIWEAMMTSSKYKLDNLCVIVDCNGLQLTGETEKVKELNYAIIEDRFNSFGFNTITVNGNNVESLLSAFSVAERTKQIPSVIIARTTKGKGVSFMENKVEWHGKAMNDEEYKIAMEELKSKEESMRVE